MLRSGSGWLAPEYHLMSWALSCLQLRQFYNDVVLYTDAVGSKILIDTLRLPYTQVICELDGLNDFHPKLWALPKIYTYQRQEEPFLHIDGDVFIWKAFDEKLLQGNLIAQNVEVSTDYYQGIMRSLKSNLVYFPDEVVVEGNASEPIYAYNAGIMGGHDLSFYNRFSRKAYEFVSKNKDRLSKIDVTNFNIFFEQHLFYCLAKQANKSVNVLLSEVIGDNKYKGFGEFVEVPHNRQYLHLLGDYKGISSVCDQMASRLRQDYPEYYYRIVALFRTQNISLVKDYYWFENNVSEEILLSKHKGYTDAYLAKTIQIIEAVGGSNQRRYNRPPAINKFLEYFELTNKKKVSLRTKELHLPDLREFENSLTGIVKGKFASISKSYLLGRDILSTQYAQYIFEQPNSTYNLCIVSDALNERIISLFDWASFDNDYPVVEFNEFLTSGPTEITTLVIPESYQRGYSLVGIDELDSLILEAAKEPTTILELFEHLRKAFDEDDFENSKPEFEKLIFGRIKRGFLNKSLKAVTMSGL